MAKKTPRTKNKDNARRSKKKTSVLVQESVEYIDYKDINLLRRFMSDRAKIRARRVTGNDSQQQKEIANAIKNAREMALLPYSVRQVTQRKGGRRERGDRDDRELREMPVPPTGTGFDRSGGNEREEILDEFVVAVDETGEPVAVAEVMVGEAGDGSADGDVDAAEEEA